MSEQSYKNHTRYRTSFHFVATPLIFITLILCVYNLVKSTADNRLLAIILLLLVIGLALTHLHSRMQPLKAQDRVIRMEENFRHFILTGRPLHSELRLRQIVALRFASDDEFILLAERAVKEKLEPKEIKQAIKSWRPDRNRV